jgi:heme A synthase
MTQFLVDAHRLLSQMIGTYSLIVGAWGLFNFLRRRPPDSNYNGALALAVILYVVEGLIGVILVLTGLSPARGIHFLYGVTIVLTIPAIFFFTRGSNSTRESLLYGLGMVFIWGLSERAAFTATTGSGF